MRADPQELKVAGLFSRVVEKYDSVTKLRVSVAVLSGCRVDADTLLIWELGPLG